MAPMSADDGTSSRWPKSSRVCRGCDFVTMTKKFRCLSKLRPCHNGQEVPVSVEDGTMSQWPRSSRVCRGCDFVKMTKNFLCLSRMRLRHDGQEAPVSAKNKKKKNVNNTNLTTPTMQFSMAPMSADDGTSSRWTRSSRVCRGCDFVTMTKKFQCLSRMGLRHNGQDGPVSVKNRKKKNVNNLHLTTTIMQFSIALVSVEDGRNQKNNISS